jgi:hypothetical protein
MNNNNNNQYRNQQQCNQKTFSLQSDLWLPAYAMVRHIP